VDEQDGKMLSSCIAIIPVRGNSKGIPRKNARLLHNKPLMAYSIESALKAKCFSEIIVTTDNEELSHIAQKYGALVLSRPPELAEDHVGLDQVIVEAVSLYEKQKNIAVDIIATIQATSPLLRPETIARAVNACIDEDRDTVLSVIDDTHLAWELNKDGQLAPGYRKRVNRQFLPTRYKETGGIVVCKRSQLKNGTRFGDNISIIECDKTESIDIDDRFDWWLAEKQLKRKKIVFRTEGYDEIGLGHIYRCLTLADSMLDHDFVFVMSKESSIGIEKVKSRFYPVVEFETGNNNELSAIESCSPDIVVNDLLDTDIEYIRDLKERKYRVINFEDQGEGIKEADAVINAMYDENSTGNERHVFTGSEYICLRDEFYSAKPITFREEAENILLLFGGTDPSNLTEKVLWWLYRINREFKITIIIGPGYAHADTLTQDVQKTGNNNIKIVSDTKIITKHMEEADIAITSGGRTVFELATHGIPMIVINQNERESRHVFTQKEFGVVNLGLGRQLEFHQFNRTVLELLNSSVLRKKMHEVLLRFDFRDGIKRVWDIILDE
jgi:CMP-N-acetylneuraminic acid synthetase